MDSFERTILVYLRAICTHCIIRSSSDFDFRDMKNLLYPLFDSDSEQSGNCFPIDWFRKEINILFSSKWGIKRYFYR